MAGFEDLPDELLVSIFDLAGRYEDHRGESRRASESLYTAIPAVCRRWRCLSLSPLLLREAAARLQEDLEDGADAESQYMACLRSLCAWLGQRAASHVRSLKLELCPYEALPLQQRDWRPEAHTLVSSALAACGSGGLRELSLRGPYGLEVGYWAGTLHALHTLRLGGMYCTEEFGDNPADVEAARANNVCMTAPLHALTALHTAALSDLNMELFEPDGLPPTLTLLSLQTVDLPYELPVLGLTHLRRLELFQLALMAANIEQLERLPALECLLIVTCSVPRPLCLDGLPALRTLCMLLEPVGGNVAALAQRMGQAVGRLEHLTCLELCPGLASWDALRRLTSLQGLYMRQPHPPLTPDAPWLRSLRWVVLPLECISQSRPALAAATRLEQLCVDCGSAGPLDDVVPVLAWAHRLAALKHLDLYMGDRRPAGITAAAAAVRHRRPNLTVTLDGRQLHLLGLHMTFV